MKKIGLLLYLLLVHTLSFAQTIHWLTFIDTTDPSVGQIDVRGREVLYNHFVNIVNSALAPKGYTADVQDFWGTNTTPENCKKAVTGLTCAKEDIIVFYYIGHGGRSVTASTTEYPWPQMCMAQHDQKKYIPLEWVGKQLAAKGARLSVTIGMCCNSESGMSHKTAPSFSANYGATYMSDAKIRNIQNLFLNERGSVLATSASPKQSSWCLNVPDFGVIDAYSGILCSIFEQSLDKPTTISWDILLNSMTELVGKYVEHPQTPFHKSNLTSANQPETRSKQPVVTKQDVKPQTKNNSESSDLQAIGTWFDALVSTNLNESTRINYAKKIANALDIVDKVKLVSQDGNTVIDSDDINTYVNRLATSRIIIKAIPISLKNEGTQMVLRIKEVYRK